ncbi:hypothetical protein [uncultured Dokdonia sp.]|uniref:hypothetical protein n=1 Tax=uncultured Dokdonia sp. TaxID=575653 RepID=UPI0026228F08|nr:hypothetical protein [uncultured Dokdonia sp.]
MILIIYTLLGFIVLVTSEDTKDDKRFYNFLKISTGIGSVGILMEVTGWNYLCPFQCILFTFSPFIALVTVKFITYIFIHLYRKEPYAIYKNQLSDGIWAKNKGHLKHKRYYNIYSAVLLVLPILVFVFIFTFLRETSCP